MSPLIFAPYYRPQVWGGRRLETILGKRLPPNEPIGEAWDLSSQSRHVSRIESGPHAGRTLNDLWRQFGSQWLSEASAKDEFPLLVKWLDCDALLSVQVHPSDALARKLLNEPRGKTEAWIILHAEPDARIYAGLKPGVDPAQLEARMQDGSVAECLYSFQPRRGDVIFIPAGTVHAAGGGIVMAEVQQTSDATFRMFDWNRMGTDGRPRQLHQSQALECIDWSRGPVEPIAWIDLDDRTQSGVRRVLESDYFRFDVVDLASDPVVLPGRSVTILMALSGDVEIEPASQGARLRTGATCLLPPRTEGWSVAAASNGGACCLRVEPVASPDA